MKEPEAQEQVWATIHATVNLGNYENVKVEMGQSKNLHNEDDPKEVRNNLTYDLMEDVEKITSEIKDSNTENIDDEWEEEF